VCHSPEKRPQLSMSGQPIKVHLAMTTRALSDQIGLFIASLLTAQFLVVKL
jgi:hypothetical protein